MIYCIWYPSGGFGHFVNSILNYYGKGFVRPKQHIKFSKNGNSHDVDYVAPCYRNNQDSYRFEFDSNCNYSLVVDNGINNEGKKFFKFFPNAKIIKMCYDDSTWPLIAHTMIIKALKSNLETELTVDSTIWNTSQDWVKREKYFLFLRDHPLRNAWKPDNWSSALHINDLLDYQTMHSALTDFGIKLESFHSIWTEWRDANKPYIEPVSNAIDMINGKWHKLNDIWSQSVFYYFIWLNYNIEVPHNDFENFFEDQKQYQSWLDSVL